VIYGCDELTGPNGGGLMHWVRVDLNAPGVEVFTTPLDAEAVIEGWQYRTAYATDAARRHGLAVAINATYFERSTRLPWPGTFARGIETLVSKRVVSHINPQCYMLWFDEAGRAHFEQALPPDPRKLERAVYGIGSQFDTVVDGKPGERTHHYDREKRTAIGVDPARNILFLAVFESATQRRTAQEMIRIGATHAMMLDGGSSSEMALGGDARGVRSGAVIGTWMPVANHFGVRAQPLD
jgi:hypothetical protein